MRNKWIQKKQEWKQICMFDKLLFVAFIWMFVCITLFIFRGANITFNSDCSAANLLAREQRMTKQFLPRTWNYSTELMVWFINLPIAFMQLFMTNEFLMRSIAVFLFVIAAIYSVSICMKYTFGSRCYLIACIWIFACCSTTFRDMLIEQAAYIVAVIHSFLCFYLFISSVDKEFRIQNKKWFLLLLLLNFANGCFSIVTIQQVILPIVGAMIILIWYKNERKQIWEIEDRKEKIKTICFLLLVSGIAFMFCRLIKSKIGYSGNAEQMLEMKNCIEIVDRFPTFLSGILCALGIDGNGNFLSLYGIKNFLHIILGICIMICPVLLLRRFKKETFQVQFFIIYAYIHIVEVLVILIFGRGSDYIGTARYMLSSICFLIVMSSYFIYQYVISNNAFYNISNLVVEMVIVLFVFFNGMDKVNLSVFGYEERYQSKYGIVDFLEEKNLAYGYASFWNAGIYSVASNFNVEIYPVNFYRKPEAYYWLTSDRGFEEENHKGSTFLMMTQEEYQNCLGENGYCFPILGEPEEILEYGSYVIQTYLYNICSNNFSGDGNFSALGLMSYSGEKLKQEDGNAVIESGHVLYGPYITLGEGNYIMETDVELKENVDLLVTDQCGKNILFRFSLQSGQNQFDFAFEEEKEAVEFNITNTSDSDIVVKEIRIKKENK